MRRCPAHCITPDVRQMHTAYQQYRDGFLPVEGGMMEQARVFSIGAQLCSSFYVIHEKREMDRGGR